MTLLQILGTNAQKLQIKVRGVLFAFKIKVEAIIQCISPYTCVYFEHFKLYRDILVTITTMINFLSLPCENKIVHKYVHSKTL